MARVLLHVCCGPCALYPVRVLREEGFEVTGLFHNPNIHPAAEYLRRREAFAQAAAALDLPVIWLDGQYSPQAWFRAVAFREDNRCFHCHHLRLERTRDIASRGRFDGFTTTLLYSKRQKHDLIASLGRDLAAGGQAEFLYRDFRLGWQEGIDRSKAMGLYRQNYCACLYSELERHKRSLDALKTSPAPAIDS